VNYFNYNSHLIGTVLANYSLMIELISLLIIAVSVISVVAIMYFFMQSFLKRGEREPHKNEPDLKMVDRPDLISRMPENETEIPDAQSARKVEPVDRPRKAG
jgi:hypothetical protein